MAQRYFGNTLTDLQNALTARDRLAAEQNIASQGNMVRFTQGTQQAMAQQAAAQQQNQLAREQMAQSGFFNQGRLQNERSRIEAEMEMAKAQADAAASNAMADRTSREKIAGITAGSRDRTPEIAAQENELATAAANLANVLNERDYIQAQVSDMTGLVGSEGIKGRVGSSGLPGLNSWDTDKKRGNIYFNQLPPSVPADPSVSFSSNVEMARTSLAAKLNELNTIVAAAQEGGAANLVTKAPTGKWVSNYRPSTQGGSRFFGTGAPSRTQAITNGAQPFFNVPAALPAQNPEALVNKIVEDFRAGRIDRATAEQGLRALGLQ